MTGALTPNQGNQQYLRKSSLLIGVKGGKALEFEDFHFRFSIKRGAYQTPNSLDVRIYNLSDNTAKLLLNGGGVNAIKSGAVDNGQAGSIPAPVPSSAEFSYVQLSAGYQNSNQYGLIFQGSVIQCVRGRESQADTYVDVRAGDGDEAYNFAVVSKSLKAGSTQQQHIDAASAAMGVPQGFIGPLQSTQLARGKVMYGPARDIMRKVATSNGSVWSIQDGTMQLVPLNSFKPGPVTVLTSATGMVGWPEQTANGIRARCLLNPNIKVGSVVQINNASIQAYQFPIGLTGDQLQKAAVPKLDADGYYTVWTVDHSGDTRGNEWYTDMVMLALNASVIPEFYTTKFKNAVPAVGPFA